LESAIHGRLRNAWQAMGDRISIRDGDAGWSGRQLLERTDRMRRSLGELGIERNEPVVVFVSNIAADFAALLAVWEAGGVVVPVHRGSPAGAFAPVLEATASRFQVDGRLTAWPDTAEPFPHAERPGVRVLGAVRPAMDPILDGAALVVFTSGSTGRPKGVVLSHTALARKLDNNQSVFGLDSADRTLLVLQMTFSFGMWVSLLTLTHRAVLVLRHRAVLADTLETLVAEKITRTALVPTTLRALVANSGAAEAVSQIEAGGQLRDIFTGGEILTAPVAEAVRCLLPGTALTNIFGLTETATSDFILGPDDAIRHPGAIGRPAPGVRYRIIDERGQPIGDDRPGELQIATATMMNGYLGQPALTEASFAGGMFRTGDMARRHPDGVVEVVGRLKELISRGANKVYPQEVEQALHSHPAVAEALVTGVPDALLGERIHAAVVLSAGHTAEAAALREWTALRLDRFKLPDAIHFVDALPLGRTGKTDRNQLRDWCAMIPTRPA